MGDFATESDGSTTNGHGLRADWIDARASIANAARRRDRGETVVTCEVCATELDVAGVVHTPSCAVFRGLRPVEESQPPDEADPPRPVSAKRDMMEEVDVEAPPQEPPAHVDGVKKHHGRTDAWSKDDILKVIRAYAEEHGRPPKSDEWQKATPGRPTTSTVVKHFGKWSVAIETAGFAKPVRGAQAGNGNRVARDWSAPWLVSVPGTGLKYRTTLEAYVAADEIEADGQRVADGARHDGQDGKADQAIDASRELAEKIRAAARAAGADDEALGEPGAVAGVDSAGEPVELKARPGSPSAPHAPRMPPPLPEPVLKPSAEPEPAAEHADGMPEPSLRQALHGLLGAVIVVLEAAQRELAVGAEPGTDGAPARLWVRPR